jgi:CubicO group peptidase (beta-lactamase class C family)
MFEKFTFKRCIAAGLALFVSASLAAAQGAAPAPSAAQRSAAAPAMPHHGMAKAHPTGFSAERLKRIDDAMQKYVDEGRISGMVGLVLQNGQPVYEKAFGFADKESSRKMTVDTIFRIASQTKAITSVAVLMLAEEGKVGLDQQVGDFIPTFKKTTVAVKSATGDVTFEPAKRPITVRHLLTHTAGINYGTSADVAKLYEAKGLGPAAGFGWYTADKDESVCVTMERLGTLPFVAHPGEAWVYGYNTDILGCIVEKASGMPLDQFIEKRITGPLGMKDTQFFVRPDQKARLATVYRSNDEGKAERAPEGARGQGHYADGPRKNFAGGAGLTSTIRDYSKFTEMIRNNGVAGGTRFLSPRMLDLMRTNQVGTLHSANGLGYGLGFETTDRFGANGLDSEGSYGWAGAYGSIYRIDPDANLSILMMVQQTPLTTDVRTKFPALVYQALTEH